jgi:hypothetical protein
MTRHKRNRKESISSVQNNTTTVSGISAASSPAPERQPQTKKTKFEERYNTAENLTLMYWVSCEAFKF